MKRDRYETSRRASVRELRMRFFEREVAKGRSFLAVIQIQLRFSHRGKLR